MLGVKLISLAATSEVLRGTCFCFLFAFVTPWSVVLVFGSALARYNCSTWFLCSYFGSTLVYIYIVLVYEAIVIMKLHQIRFFLRPESKCSVPLELLWQPSLKRGYLLALMEWLGQSSRWSVPGFMLWFGFHCWWLLKTIWCAWYLCCACAGLLIPTIYHPLVVVWVGNYIAAVRARTRHH